MTRRTRYGAAGLAIALVVMIWVIAAGPRDRSPERPPPTPTNRPIASGLSVRVSTHEGVPIEGATVRIDVRAKGLSWKKVELVRTGPDGTAPVLGVPPGLLRAALVDGGEWALPVEYPPKGGTRDLETPATPWTGSPTVLDLTTELGGVIELRGDDPIDASVKVTGTIRRRRDDGQWRFFGDSRGFDVVKRPLGSGGQVEFVARFRGVPRGRYLVRSELTGRAPASQELDVAPGRVTTATFRVGTATPAFRLLVDGCPDGTRFHLIRWDEVLTGSYVSGVVGSTASIERGARVPGRYLLLYWPPLAVGRLVDVTEPPTPILLSAPPPTPEGPRTLTVHLRHGGVGVGTPLIALLPGGGKTASTGEWFAFRDAASQGARFASLTPGRYRVAVFDGVYGDVAGFFVSPKVVEVEIASEDRVIELEL